jgi:hypothetical protein
VAALLADLSPDGTWNSDLPMWHEPDGPGRRLLAAVQLGADSTDPRLHAAAEVLFETAPGEGGFALDHDQVPLAWLTARVLQALAELGWCHHARFQEGLAWLDEAAPRSLDGGWARDGDECEVTPIAVLAALDACGEKRRADLRRRAVDSILRAVAEPGEELSRFGHPCLDRTDLAEGLAALARSGVPLATEMVPALGRIQGLQLEGARWKRDVPVPTNLPVGNRLAAGEHSRWITLKCAAALLHYGVEAGLPRMYPQKPTQ